MEPNDQKAGKMFSAAYSCFMLYSVHDKNCVKEEGKHYFKQLNMMLTFLSCKERQHHEDMSDENDDYGTFVSGIMRMSS